MQVKSISGKITPHRLNNKSYPVINYLNDKPYPVISKNIENDIFIKSPKTLSFKGNEDISLVNKNVDIINTEADTYLHGTSYAKIIQSCNAELFDNSKADVILAQYLTLHDKSTVKDGHAEISATIHTDKPVGIITASSINIQTNKGGKVKIASATGDLSIGMQSYVQKAKGSQVSVFNDAKVDRIKAWTTKISDKAKVDRIDTSDSVRIRDEAFADKIFVRHHAGISGDGGFGTLVMTGKDAEVHLMDTPHFDKIIFKKGGKVILHKNPYGHYPKIKADKVEGGVIEKTGALASNNHLAPTEALLEYHNNF